MINRVPPARYYAFFSKQIRFLGFGLFLIIMACNQTTITSENQGTGAQSVAAIRITPANVNLAVGQTLQLSVWLGDAAGNMMPTRMTELRLVEGTTKKTETVIGDSLMRTGRIVAWSSSKPDRVRIDADGQITALAPGEATITAMSDELNGKMKVVVTMPSKAPLIVIPASARLSVGEELHLKSNCQNLEGDLRADQITWGSDQPSIATISPVGLLKAKKAGEVTITARCKGQLGTAVIWIMPADTIYGIDFPGNSGTNTTMRFEFTSPLAAYPATYIWRAYPRQQQSYYTAFFWGNNGAFYRSNTYYGFHPYPDWKTEYQHFWEIAAPPGRDFVSQQHVVYDRWYTQVAVCRKSGTKTIHEFYWNWPDTIKVVRHTGNQHEDPPMPGLVIGDAPWNHGNEVWDGVLRGFQFYDVALTQSEISKEIASPGQLLTPWYLNLNPVPSDISDKSGNGHNPAWVGNERPSQWSGLVIGDTIIRTTIPPR
jgi:hypothetical protein